MPATRQAGPTASAKGSESDDRHATETGRRRDGVTGGSGPGRVGRRPARERVTRWCTFTEGYGSRYVFTERDFSDEYRRELERAVVFLSGESGPFDGNKRYEFGIIPEGEQAGRAYSDFGSTAVWQLSQADPDVLESALRSEAKRRAGNAVIRFNAGHAEDRTGFYVTVTDARSGARCWARTPPRRTLRRTCRLGKRLAKAVNDRAIWYAYGVTKVTMKPGQDLPAGKLEHLTERQMALAEAKSRRAGPSRECRRRAAPS